MHKNKLLLWMLAAVIAFGALCPAVKADTAELSVSASSGEVEVGDWVEITVTFSSNEKLAGVYARVTYDHGLLEYTGGDAEGDTGSLTISRMEQQAKTVLSYTLYFSAKAEGTAVVSVTESGMYDEQANVVGSPTADASVVIRKGASLSSDASLKSLQTSYGRLEPDFRSDVFEYTMTVPYEITTLTLTAAANTASAAVQVSGLAELAVGENRRSVRVMAPDGTTSLYTIVITREEEKTNSGSETSGAEDSEISGEEADTPSFKVAGKTLYWQDVPQDEELPDGFLKTTYDYSGYRYEVATVADGSLILMYLTDFRGENGALYLFNPEFNTCRRSIPVNLGGSPLVLLNADEGAFSAEGADLQNVEIAGYPLRAYVFPDYPAEYVIYSSQGRYLTYHVDTEVLEEYSEKPKPEESSVQEESASSIPESKPEEPAANSRAEESKPEANPSGTSSMLARLLARFSGLVKYLPYILYILIALALIVIVLLVVLITGGRGKRRRTAKDYDKATAVTVGEQIEASQKETAETPEEEIPERPEDVRLDQEAFEHWKETTQSIPLSPMTEVHHTTFEAVTGNIPKVKEAVEEQEVKLSENAAEAAKAAAAVWEGETKEPEDGLDSILPKTDRENAEEDGSKELSPEDFFE